MTRARLFIQTLVMALSLVVLTSCGGGGGAAALISSITGGGVGSGGTGLTLGTVIGFGSIITDSDSTHYDSSTGTYYAGSNTASSTLTSSTVLGVGQQLEITLNGSTTPSVVQSAPSLIGAVSLVNQTSGITTSFVVNNLTVNLNTNLSQGPITYFVGYSATNVSPAANAITLGDQVEVHGFYAQDSNGYPYVQATRVVLLPSTNQVTRTLGVISNLGSTSFTLAGSASQSSETISTASSPVITPSGVTALANGQFVSVWSSSRPTINNNVTTVTANAIRVRSIASNLPVKITGLVYNLSGTNFKVSGVSVNGAASALVTTMAGLANGTYVVVSGTTDGSGTLVASSVTTSATTTIELKGTITNFVNAYSFQVRGTLVDASSPSLAITGLTNGVAGLANGVYVDLFGHVSGNTVVASTITAQSSAPSSSTVEYVGTVSSYTSGASSFQLTAQDGNTYTFNIASNVGYESTGSTACTLATGSRVDVEATLSGSTYTAYGIRCLLSSGTNAQTGTSEVAGVVSNVQSTGSGYSFEINNIRVTGTGSLPSTFVNGANVDVHINSTNTNSSTESSTSSPHVDD